ncbi:MAG: ABC transporter ATP-binding protein [Bacilli bacterium]
MSKMSNAMNIMLKGCKFKYYFYFFVLLITNFLNIMSSYASKILVDILEVQGKGSGFNTPVTALPDSNQLEIWFSNLFGGIEFLSTHLYMFSIIIVVIAFSNGLFLLWRMFMRSEVQPRMSKNMQNELFYHIERLPYTVIKDLKNGDIIQTCTHDEDVLRRFATQDMYLIVSTIYIVVLAFGILAVTNIKIALISMCLMPFLFIYSFFVIKEVRVRYRATDDSEGRMSDKLEENLASVRLVKAFNNEKYEIDDFEKYITDYRGKYMHWRKLSAFFYASSDIFVFAEIALTSLYGFYLAYKGEITTGTMVISFTFVNMMVWPIRDVATVLSNLARAMASLDRINLILHEPLEDIYSGDKPEIKGGIEFKDVSFMFCDSKEATLKDINFKIEPGQTVAIMGKTGCGKSTLAYLLTRLYDYSSGQILIDGVDITKIQKHYLRSNVSIVLQDPFLFSKTIEDNIKIARQDASQDEIIRAASISHIHDNIMQFKNGYRTPVGEKGTTLSGGQKQRVAIARTIITNSPVLIFDDSLSAVDTETDYLIRKSLAERKKQSTTLIITHRISTARDADLIIILEDGQISEIGKHNDLIKKDGLYKRIYEIQTKMV